jgi:hypothetical protein
MGSGEGDHRCAGAPRRGVTCDDAKHAEGVPPPAGAPAPSACMGSLESRCRHRLRLVHHASRRKRGMVRPHHQRLRHRRFGGRGCANRHATPSPVVLDSIRRCGQINADRSATRFSSAHICVICGSKTLVLVLAERLLQLPDDFPHRAILPNAFDDERHQVAVLARGGIEGG